MLMEGAQPVASRTAFLPSKHSSYTFGGTLRTRFPEHETMVEQAEPGLESHKRLCSELASPTLAKSLE